MGVFLEDSRFKFVGEADDEKVSERIQHTKLLSACGVERLVITRAAKEANFHRQGSFHQEFFWINLETMNQGFLAHWLDHCCPFTTIGFNLRDSMSGGVASLSVSLKGTRADNPAEALD